MSLRLKIFHVYLLACAVAGGIVIYLATSKVGPGISSDATYYLSVATSLIRGKGLPDFEGHELTQFPPIYPLLLALGSLITRQDIVVVGRFLNILVFGTLVWASGMYFYKSFEDELLFAYMGGFIVLSSTSLMQISSNIAPDPLFLLIVLVFLFTMANYIKTKDPKWAILAGLLTLFGCFLRYAGLSLVITGTILMLYANRENIKRSIVPAGIFCLLTAMPILAWGLLHNYLTDGTVFGFRGPSIPALNFSTGVEKILYWFIPHQIIAAVGAVPLFIVLLLLAGLVVWATGYRQFLAVIQSPVVVAALAFLLVYSGILIFNVSYYELKQLGKDRVHIIILPVLLTALFAVVYRFIKVMQVKFSSRWVYAAVIPAFLFWAIYPIAKSAEYLRNSMQNGDVSANNNFNRASFWDSDFVKFVQKLQVGEEKIYTNYQDPVWYIFRCQVYIPPHSADFQAVPDDDYLQQNYKGWPGPGNEGYLIWFKSAEFKQYFATPEQIASIADLTEIYSDTDGTVFYIRTR